jgi:hypothetical protein
MNRVMESKGCFNDRNVVVASDHKESYLCDSTYCYYKSPWLEASIQKKVSGQGMRMSTKRDKKTKEDSDTNLKSTGLRMMGEDGVDDYIRARQKVSGRGH